MKNTQKHLHTITRLLSAIVIVSFLFSNLGVNPMIPARAQDLQTDTPTSSEPPTGTPTLSVTPTETPVSTETPTDTPTLLLTPTETPTFSETPTEIPSLSETPTETPTLSETPTETPTPTFTPTYSSTASITPTSGDGLVAYWKMDEGSGTTVVDSSGHGHDQKFVSSPGNPAWSTDVPPLMGPNNSSLSFDGGDYSYSYPIPEMAGVSQLTVEGWVKFNGPFNGFQTLASAFQINSQTLWWFGTDSNNELRVYLANQNYDTGSLAPAGWTVDADLQTGQWYHVAFVYDGNAATRDQQLKIYVNGKPLPVASYYSYSTFPSALPNASPIVHLGHEPGLYQYYPSTPLNGNLDEWRIYTVAQNSTDIANAASGSLAPIQPGPNSFSNTNS